jgi:four helix bundle protein
MIAGHRNLIAWQRAMDLAANAYAFGKSLRSLKHSDLASQLERAAVSIPANISEGRGRATAGEFNRYLSVALGSLREVETILEIADRVGAGKRETIMELQKTADEVGKVLFGLRRVAEKARSESRRPMPRADS